MLPMGLPWRWQLQWARSANLVLEKNAHGTRQRCLVHWESSFTEISSFVKVFCFCTHEMLQPGGLGDAHCYNST
jgi:hypothetical protein